MRYNLYKYSVYCIYDCYNYNIVYVGSTTRKLYERFTEHKKRCSTSPVRKYIEDNGHKLNITVIEYCDCYDDMLDREYFWTMYYKSFFNIVNKDIGKYHGKSFFEKVSGNNHVNYGKHLSYSVRRKISNSLTGHKMSKDSIAKGAASRTGKHHSSEWCNNISMALRNKYSINPRTCTCISVTLVNTGEVFISSTEAGKINNIPPTNITACCKGKRKSAGKDSNGNKLIWKYTEYRCNESM